MKGYIYKYVYPNGKVYIGQTRVSVKERHYQHMSASKDPKRRTTCELAIAKYGEPELEILETIEVKDSQITKLVDLLNEAEVKWIKEYDSTNRGKGYNIQNGGNIVTPEEFILQEKWYEIYEKDKWEESLNYVYAILMSIKNKMFITHEKLDKEEKYIWFGYKFKDYDIGKETTFSSFYNRNKNGFMCDVGDLPIEILEILEDEGADLGSRKEAEKIRDEMFFQNIIDYAVKENWIQDIRETIWNQINKNKDKIISEFYRSIK